MIEGQAANLLRLGALAHRWMVSTDVLRRLIDRGELKAIYIGGCRLVPMDEVLRVERDGIGGRKQRSDARRPGKPRTTSAPAEPVRRGPGRPRKITAEQQAAL